MFRIVTNPSFAHDVAIEVPVDGGFDAQTARVRFKVIGVEALKGFDLGSLDGQKAFLDEAVIAFEDLAGDDGKPVPHSDAVKRVLIDIPFVRRALLETYQSALMGAKRKN